MQSQKGYCIFNNSFGGAEPAQRDENGFPLTYATRELAEREIARSVVTRIMQQFNQPAEFADPDAITIRDYIEEVEILDNGVVVDHEGNRFGKDDEGISS